MDDVAIRRRLDRTMGQLVLELTLISEVAAAKQGDVIHGGEPNHMPKGPARSTAELFANRYLAMKQNAGRRTVITDARQAIRDAKLGRSAGHGFVPDTLEWRVAVAKAEGSIDDVAHRFGVARSTVYRCRQAFPRTVRASRTAGFARRERLEATDG